MTFRTSGSLALMPALIIAQCAFGQTTFTMTAPSSSKPAPAPTKTTNTQTTFDVATVKAYAPPEAKTGAGGRGRVIMMGSRGGPGTDDPARYVCSGCTLMMLMTQAYNAQPWELTIPSFMDSERFEVTAKVPEGATEAQFRLMLQALLAERFKLTVHREKKELQTYELQVAKGGSKLKESGPEPPAAPATGDGGTPVPAAPVPAGPTIGGNGRAPLPRDKDGFPIFPKGPDNKGLSTMVMRGRARMQADTVSMEEFVKQLSTMLGKPVSDATGLQAKYDFMLTYDPASTGGGRGLPGGFGAPTSGSGSGLSGAGSPLESTGSDDAALPTIFGALQSQLGLKLEQKKGTAEIMVVDHVEKTPTEN